MPLAAGGWAGILKTQDTTHARGAQHGLSTLKLSAEEAIADSGYIPPSSGMDATKSEAA